MNLRNVEEKVILATKRSEMLKHLGQKYKMNYYKISKLIKDSGVSKFVSRKLIGVNDLLKEK